MHRTSRSGRALITSVAVALLLPLFAFLENDRAAAVINTGDRAAVVAAFQNTYEPQFAVPNGWTGSVAGCNAGGQSVAYQNATINTFNWFREMAGLPTVTENAAFHQEQQETALMMHAQGALSHNPPNTWACYTALGANGAATSNLAGGNAGPHAVRALFDDGVGNLGHRRWIICPTMSYTSHGSTDNWHSQKTFGGTGQHAQNRNLSPQWISWPPPGFVPHQTVFPSWSLSFNDTTGGGAQADFSNATVTVTENGNAVPTTVAPTANGFCDNTLRFQPQVAFAGSSPDRTFTVTVSNIAGPGVPTTHTYDVTVIEASSCPSPVNDNPATRIDLGTTFNTTVMGTNTCATQEGGFAWFLSSPPLETVWYEWTAPATGTMTATTCSANTNFDTDITLVDPVSSNLLAYNNDDNGCASNVNQSTLVHSVTMGTTYWFRMDGAGNADGNFELTVSMPGGGPTCTTNDEFCGATTIGGPPATMAGTNVGYTVETGEPAGPCWLDTGAPAVNNSAWYTWTAPASGNVTFDTETSAHADTQLAAWTGMAVGALTAVPGGCDDDTGTNFLSSMTFAATGGTKYYIQVDGWDGAAGTFNLNVSGPVAAPMCNGLAVTVNLNDAVPAPVTAGPDVILGTPGNDTISGFGGNDTICGEGGNDTIYGSNGNDTIFGGPGDDTLLGNAGLDTLNGGDGNDVISGNEANDVLNGDGGNDTMYGVDGDDTINGGAGDDTVLGDTGNDTIDGGADNDLISGNTGNDVVDGGDGNDTIYGVVGNDTLRGNGGMDIILGGVGTDNILGGDDNDQISGNEDNDTISGGGGNDAIYGVDGSDILNGDAGMDTILGGNGDDTINGGTEDDLLSGNAGADIMDGGAGNDTMYGVDGDDTMTGGPGTDVMLGGPNDDTINSNGDGAIDNVSGNGGFDTCNRDVTDNVFTCEAPGP